MSSYRIENVRNLNCRMWLYLFFVATKREDDGLPVFDLSLFHIRYYKKTGSCFIKDTQDADTLLEEFPEEHTPKESESSEKILSVCEK